MSEYARKKKPDPARHEKREARSARAPQAQQRGPVPAGPIYAAGPNLGLVQRKVEIGPADDAYEREADQTADKVMAGKKAPPVSAISADSGSKEKAKQDEKETAKAKADAKEKEAKQAKKEAKAAEEEQQVQRKSAAPEEEKKDGGGAPKKGGDSKGKKADDAKGKKPEESKEKKPVQTMPMGKDPGKAEEEKAEQAAKAQEQAKQQEKPEQAAAEKPQAEQKPGKEEEEKPIQSKSEGGAGPGRGASAEAAAAEAINNKGPGKSLEPEVKKQLEPAFGADLSHVRVHDDANAHEAAKAMNARAFTHGNDIWLGKGQSQKDTRLMAHEVTHVFQQGNVIRRDAATETDTAGGGGAPGADDKRTGKREGDTIIFDELKMPNWKVDLHPAQPIRPAGYNREEEEDVSQRTVWEQNAANFTEPATELQRKAERAYRGRPPNLRALMFETPGGHIYGPGTYAGIARQMSRPRWTKTGREESYDVDHQQELQLGGQNVFNNMALVQSSLNSSSGSTIKADINRKVQSYIDKQPDPKPSIEIVKTNYSLKFERKRPEGNTTISRGQNVYERDDISDAEHVKISQVRVKQNPDRGTVIVFADQAGSGGGVSFSTDGGLTNAEKKLLKPFEVTAKNITPGDNAADATGPLGSITIQLKPGHKHWKEHDPITIPIHRMADAPFAGYLDQAAVQAAAAQFNLKLLSPVTITSFGVGDGVEVAGRINPSVPLLRDHPINFQISGGETTFFKTFNSGEINLPRPFSISNAALTIFASDSGVGVEGKVDFGIEKVGTGFLRAAAQQNRGFALQGGFDFDSNLFERAHVELNYRDEQLSGSGDLAIGEGKVKGIKRGTLHVEFDREGFRVSGSVEPKIPGVQSATVTAAYSEQEGFLIAGDLELADIPGIQSGSVHVQLTKNDEGYDFAASGTATPAIPGVNSQITIEYAKGLFKGELTADYSRGMLSGQIQVGITNQPVDEATGQPAGGEGGNDLRMYGGGSVTIQIAPWLQGTIGIKLLENGEIEVSGEVALPSTLDVFPQKAINKEIFSINIDIPIVGVSVLGQRIGIFATIGGSLSANASIGPGQLQDVALGVVYNPDHEDQTQVTGTAKFHVPANAGLRLAVRGGIGAGIPIVSATAGLEIGGELGLEGAVDTSVNVNWNPTQGLSIDALGEFYVQPVFKFDVSGYVDVSADLLFDTIELYHERWQLASFEYGSNLRFGIKFPIRYREGQDFDISLSDVEFVVPEIDPMSTLEGLMDQIA